MRSLGAERDLFDVEGMALLTLESIGQVSKGKLRNVAMKECTESL